MAKVVGNTAVELVVRQIEKLNFLQASEGERDGTGQEIFTYIKHYGLLEVTDFEGQTPFELVLQEENLGEVRRVAHALRERAREAVVGKREVPGRRGPEILREAPGELVIVDKDHIEVPLEEFRVYRPGKLVEPEVQED